MHSAGTTVGELCLASPPPPLRSQVNQKTDGAIDDTEGSWDDVMRVIGQAHALVHQGGVLRVQSSMRVGTRTDKSQTAEQKVKRIEDILAKDASA
jgi:uncharacterized protein (TIGR00106 family)